MAAESIDKPMLKTMKSTMRFEKIVNQAPLLAPYMEKAKPLLANMVVAFELVVPYLVIAGQKASELYKKTPMDIVYVIIGLIFCFAGGLYPALFAAIEAARLTGYATAIKAVNDLKEEGLNIIAESKKDDAKDDGKTDSKMYILRKTNLVLTKCDPAKVNGALGGLYVSWIAIIAVLKVQFARVVTLALSIAEHLEEPCQLYVTPALKTVVPAEYHKWLPICAAWVCKWIAISIAWWIQRILSAASTAARGGLMASRHLMKFLHEHDLNPGGILPKDHNDTYIDEIAGWSLAAIGFLWQLHDGFSAPFPLNWILWPCSVAESYIRWSITTTSVPGV